MYVVNVGETKSDNVIDTFFIIVTYKFDTKVDELIPYNCVLCVKITIIQRGSISKSNVFISLEL